MGSAGPGPKRGFYTYVIAVPECHHCPDIRPLSLVHLLAKRHLISSPRYPHLPYPSIPSHSLVDEYRPVLNVKALFAVSGVRVINAHDLFHLSQTRTYTPLPPSFPCAYPHPDPRASVKDIDSGQSLDIDK
jgi:hypothetical protein